MLESALELHPEALEEALAGYAWYLEHSETTADRFFGELERAVRLILQGPHRWSAYLHGTRRMVLVKFPYSVVYRAWRFRKLWPGNSGNSGQVVVSLI